MTMIASPLTVSSVIGESSQQTVLPAQVSSDAPCPDRAQRSLRVLMFYDANSTYTSTVREYLESFRTHSHHDIYYASGVRNTPCQVDLGLFDVVVFHYSMRLTYPDFISLEVAEAMRAFDGFKVLYIQDEYEATATAQQWIRDLGFDVVYSVVPEPYLHQVYPPDAFPGVTFFSTLTGFVPDSLMDQVGGDADIKPMAQRHSRLAYRGRYLPYWYGQLAQEKMTIGIEMKRLCAERGVPVDIEWEDQYRIYGPNWYRFLKSSRAMLGTESGANIFDDHRHIQQRVTAALEARPDMTFEQARAEGLVPEEGPVKMNQISPKFFEAIACRTALVLFEGNYSGVLTPDVHYIPLKKDYSNVDTVLARLEDTEALEAMVDRAFTDVVASGRFGYKPFVRHFDQCLESRVTPVDRPRIITAVVGSETALPGPAPASVTMLPTLHDDYAVLCPMPMTQVLEIPRRPSVPKRKRTVVTLMVREIKRVVKRSLRPLYEWACDL
ncbi:MAG: hypothetical protein KC474_10410 [Cyanobacteria bacterium HKST-UBA04]|nr:hypothetical protein [Cyanobacteria bacterium HKST-UBA04]